VLVTTILLSLLLLVLYYTQNFKEKFTFKDNITLEDLKIDYVNSAENSNIRSISANLGELTLINGGTFSWLYTQKVLRGCINFKSSNHNRETFNIVIKNKSNDLFEAASSYYPSTIEIMPGEKRTFSLVTTYYPYSTNSLSDFQEDITNISIYMLNSEGDNSFSLDGYAIKPSYASCSSLTNEKLIKVFSFS